MSGGKKGVRVWLALEPAPEDWAPEARRAAEGSEDVIISELLPAVVELPNGSRYPAVAYYYLLWFSSKDQPEHPICADLAVVATIDDNEWFGDFEEITIVNNLEELIELLEDSDSQ